MEMRNKKEPTGQQLLSKAENHAKKSSGKFHPRNTNFFTPRREIVFQPTYSTISGSHDSVATGDQKFFTSVSLAYLHKNYTN